MSRLAEELDSVPARGVFRDALVSLQPVVAARPAAAGAVERLLADGDYAWRCLAAGLLAAELGE